MRPLLALPYLNIYLHPAPQPVLELEWLCYAASADVRAAVLQAVQLSLEHHVKAWITDDRLQGAIRPRDLEWAEQAVLLPLSAAGLERFARLEAHDALHRLTVEGLYTRLQPQLRYELRRFEAIGPARAWASGAGAD
ncbi:MAG: hypothetical protein EOO36_04135 [Cytophagaceae bacterium]|nr:MAG: hypothetical protein EOO36_04135 [Cytophagaceae bacterium]